MTFGNRVQRVIFHTEFLNMYQQIVDFRQKKPKKQQHRYATKSLQQQPNLF